RGIPIQGERIYEPDVAVIILLYIKDLIRNFSVKRCELLSDRIEKENTSIGPRPYNAGFIDKQGPDKIAAQPIRAIRVAVENLERVPVIPVNAILRAEPHETHVIQGTAQHHIIR